MSFFNRREDRHPPITDCPARPSEGCPEPPESVQDELGLLGPGHAEKDDPLLRRSLPSKPDDYFSLDPGRFHHEVL